MISLLRKHASPSRGSQAESQAALFLQKRGMKVIVRNYRCRWGEIDLIMRDGEHLVFVEVRQRSRPDHGSPLETITASKRRKLIRTARYFVSDKKISEHRPMRFDVVGIESGAQIEWVPDAFWE